MSDIEVGAGDRVTWVEGNSILSGIVISPVGGSGGSALVARVGAFPAWVRHKDLRVLERASYTDVKPAEHPAVTELRSAWVKQWNETLETGEGDARNLDYSRLACAVLAVIDLPAELQAEVTRWRAATGVASPDVAERLIGNLRERGDDVARAAQAEVTRLRAELVDAKVEIDLLTRERDQARDLSPKRGDEAEAADLSAWLSYPHRIVVDAKGYVWRQFTDDFSMAPVNSDNSPIPKPLTAYVPEVEATWLRAERDEIKANAEAASAASSRLVEAMEELADEFVERGINVDQRAYGFAAERIRAAVKAATETGCNG